MMSVVNLVTIRRKWSERGTATPLRVQLVEVQQGWSGSNPPGPSTKLKTRTTCLTGASHPSVFAPSLEVKGQGRGRLATKEEVAHLVADNDPLDWTWYTDKD